MSSEVEHIQARYAKRKQLPESLYNPLAPDVYLTRQEKERGFICWIRFSGMDPVQDKRVIEIGCGAGRNLLQFIQLGFRPENLVGNELLEERAVQARQVLPAHVRILVGDAATVDFGGEQFDVVFQSTVFTSILDDAFQQKLADRMWTLVKSGGGVLWYDFIYNNPANLDVRGVPVRRVRALFPEGDLKVWKLTLAPPISRRVTKIHPSCYTLFNLLPFLRTHVLCWIKKT